MEDKCSVPARGQEVYNSNARREEETFKAKFRPRSNSHMHTRTPSLGPRTRKTLALFNCSFPNHPRPAPSHIAIPTLSGTPAGSASVYRIGTLSPVTAKTPDTVSSGWNSCRRLLTGRTKIYLALSSAQSTLSNKAGGRLSNEESDDVTCLCSKVFSFTQRSLQ